MDLITGDRTKDPLPWIALEATVIDEIDFTTGIAFRGLQIEFTHPQLAASRTVDDTSFLKSSFLQSWFGQSNRGAMHPSPSTLQLNQQSITDLQPSATIHPINSLGINSDKAVDEKELLIPGSGKV